MLLLRDKGFRLLPSVNTQAPLNFGVGQRQQVRRNLRRSLLHRCVRRI